MTLPSALLSFWQSSDDAHGAGNKALLDHPLTAFFASRQCSGAAIRAAMDWAIRQARDRAPIVSGFYSPLEQSVLNVMLAADAPVVMVIARPIRSARLLGA